MENERPIEKLLRRYAAKRREDAGAAPELRHFQRKQLQSAVARRASSSRHRRETSFWPRWRRLIFVGGGLALVGVYALVLQTSWNWSKSNKDALTRAENELTKKPDRPALPKDSLAVMPAEPVGGLAAAGAPEPAPQAPTANKNEPAKIRDADGFLIPLSITIANNEPETELGDAAGPLNDSVHAKSPGQHELMNAARFAKVNPPPPPAQAMPAQPTPVLNRFRMEQSGDQLRVVDDDGSTYSGSIQLAVNAPAARSDELKEKIAAAKPQTVAVENQGFRYSFNVSGINLTLKQSVVFTGNFFTITNGSNGVARLGYATQAVSATPPFPQLTNFTVTGEAKVENGPVIEINAVPVAP